MQKELQVIMDLMKELQDKMEYGEEDLSERLGRKKPELEVMKIEGEMPEMEDEKPEVELELGGGMDMEEDCEPGMESPEYKLKKRLMKLRS